MPIQPKPSASRKITASRVISIATLLMATTALLLALRKPQQVTVPQTRTAIAVHAQSFQDKVEQLAQPQADAESATEVHLTPDEINAAIVQASGAIAQSTSTDTSSAPAGMPQITSASSDAPVDLQNLSEPIVSFEGDQIKGQFLSELAGKKVYVTVAGHLGSKDGYASFDPTEFKIGDLNVPVALVNDALQKKLLEQRDRLKLPDYVSDIRVQNGELVVTRK